MPKKENRPMNTTTIATAPGIATGTEYEWDVCASEYLYIGDGDTISIEILDEGIKAIDNYRNDCVEFSIRNIDEDTEQVWRVTSRRVLRTLVGYRPLTGKRFTIKRSGEGYDTRYAIRDISNMNEFVEG
jgi:hypothetical protein